jgi:ferredoxin
MAFRSKQIRLGVFGLAVLLSLPVLPAPFMGLYLWASPFILFNSVLAGKSLVILQLIALPFLVISIFRKRWICRYVCPTGVVCDFSSNLRKGRGSKWHLQLNRSLALAAIILALFGVPLLMVADPFNLFFMAFEGTRTGLSPAALIKLSGLLFLVVFSLIFPDAWCASVCPLGGLQLQLSDAKDLFSGKKSLKRIPAAPGKGRRFFLSVLAGTAGGILLSRFWPTREREVIRPPFSLAEDQLDAVCIRCGSCSSACPTGILHPSLDFSHPASLLTPEVRYVDSYCLEDCNDCGEVCPSGAIRKFKPADKPSFVMGMAEIRIRECYLQIGKECSLCRQYCAYDAVEIRSAPASSSRYPVILEECCVGCGACQVVCPPRVIGIKAWPPEVSV